MTDKVKKILEKSKHKPRSKSQQRHRGRSRANAQSERQRVRKLGPREIGRKRKSSWQPVNYNLRKPSLDGFKPRTPRMKPLPAVRERKLGPREIGRKRRESYDPPDYNLRKPSLEIFKPRLMYRPHSLDLNRQKVRVRKPGPREIGRFSRRSYSPPNYPVYNDLDCMPTRHRRRSSQPNIVRHHRDESWSDDFSEDGFHLEEDSGEYYYEYSYSEEKYDDDFDPDEPGESLLHEKYDSYEREAPEPNLDKKIKAAKKAVLRMALENIEFDDSDEEPEPPLRPIGRRVRFADP